MSPYTEKLATLRLAALDILEQALKAADSPAEQRRVATAILKAPDLEEPDTSRRNNPEPDDYTYDTGDNQHPSIPTAPSLHAPSHIPNPTSPPLPTPPLRDRLAAHFTNLNDLLPPPPQSPAAALIAACGMGFPLSGMGLPAHVAGASPASLRPQSQPPPTPRGLAPPSTHHSSGIVHRGSTLHLNRLSLPDP